MKNSPCIFSIRPLVPNAVRFSRRRPFKAGAVSSGMGFVVRHFALADASRSAWLNAPLFSRYQPQSAIVRHAA